MNIKEILEEKVIEYNDIKFFENDPISIPRRFQLKEDIEVTAFYVQR